MQYINIPLKKNEAIVFFEFLSNLSQNVPKFQYPSEEIVMNNLLSILEQELSEPFQADYKVILDKARSSFS
jgi:hypothetical protein